MRVGNICTNTPGIAEKTVAWLLLLQDLYDAALFYSVHTQATTRTSQL